MQPRRRRIGGLEAIEFAASSEAPTLVCFHGYGADAADLARLAMEADLAGPARWVFPDAPLTVDMGGFSSGRAWFPINGREIEIAQLEGKTLDWSQDRASIMAPTLEKVRKFIEALELPWEKLILGGFSQGAVLSLELALDAPQAPRGLFMLSGTLVDEASLRRRVPARAGLAYFQSHGTQDPLLGFEQAKILNEILDGAGLKGTFLSFEGGHSVPPEALEGLTAYVDSLTAARERA